MSDCYFDESQIVGRLDRWARKKLDTGIKLGYPRESAFRKLSPSGAVSFVDAGIELEFEQTESAVRNLPEILQLVVRKEFLSTCKNEGAKAYQLGISIRTFRQYKCKAYRIMSNFLNLVLTDGAGKMYKSAML